MLNTLELSDLEDQLMSEFENNLMGILTNLNRTGRLQEFLGMIGLSKLMPQPVYKPYKSGKIVVVGGTEVKESVLSAVAENIGINKNRLEFCLDYERAQKFNYKKMLYSPNYSLIIFGPIGHSGYEKGDYGSVISSLENVEGYPPVIKAGTNSLKLSKQSFKNALNEAISNNLISIG